jgi:outer membrane immunogenic protein
MKRILASIGTTLLFAGSALAADMPLKAPPLLSPAFSWDGIYVGANGGYGRADADWRGSIVLNGTFDVNTQSKGSLWGAQIGINKQFGHLVLGAELTGDWFSWTQTVPVSTTTGGAFSGTTKLRDLDTLTVRLGYAFNNVLLYGKAGGATGVASVEGSTPGGFSFTFAPPSQHLYGATAGAGIEFGLTRNIIVGVEYDFTRLGTGSFNTVDAVGNAVSVGTAHGIDVQSVVGRVGYKF